MAKKQGLGRGLGSLISETTVEAKAEELSQPDKVLPLDKIHRNENQPRTNFDEGELEELAESIRQVGVLQPILVRPDGDGYEIVAGERRYQASRKAGLTEIPVVIRDVDDEKLSELALIENIQRSDLNPIEEARAMRDILERTNITQEELARRLSKSRSSIANALRLLDLPETIQSYVKDGDLTAGHARAILSLKDETAREKLAQAIMIRHLSVRQAEELASSMEGTAAGRPAKKEVPPQYERAATALKKSLGTDVRIKTGRKNNKLEITIHDDEQLERIVQTLSLIGDIS